MNRQLKDAVDVGLIRPSHSEFSSPILFVRKADGLLRLCIDCHGLNEVKRKYAYPLPRVNDTLTELNDGNFCTHLELVLAFGFWQVRVREEDVHKTTFQTPNGRAIVMPFGMCNARAAF
jgi:hypothetical protein